MSIKISQFTNIGSVADTNLLPIVEETSPLTYNSFKVDASTLKTYFLQGNADTATNLASTTDTLASTVLYSSLTSVGTLLDLTVTNTISGNIETANALSTARNINGVPFDGSQDITIVTSIAPATTTAIGGIIVGGDLTVQVDGTLAVDTSTIATKTYVDNTSTDNAISFSVALG